MIVLYFVLMILCLYFFINLVYLLVFAIAGLFRLPNYHTKSEKKNRIVVIIPAYKDDSVIIDTALNAINHDYPKDAFQVVVVGDQLKLETIKLLSELPILFLNVSFAVSTKAKALKYAVSKLENDYDIAVILDSDNVMGAGCLDLINSAFENGFKLVQLHRTAKNKNTPVAVLDGISEEVNNHIFRKGHRVLGLSSALIGSGMAVDYSIFVELLKDPDIANNPGEDRELYLKLLEKGIICEYIEDGHVYDEKVQSSYVLQRQRTRWLSAQLQYARLFWIEKPLSTLKANINYIDYAFQTLLLPRILLFGLVFISCLLSIFIQVIFHAGIYPIPIILIGLTCLCFFIVVISVYRKISLFDFLSSLLALPKVFYAISIALVKSKSNKSEFIHTPKEFIDRS